jgi:hypothetical protein
VRLSREGGTWPQWRSDGTEIFFVAEGRNLMAVEVIAGATFTAGDPRRLFATRRKRTFSREYDVAPDGQRFLVNATLADENVPPITLVQNWQALLKR